MRKQLNNRIASALLLALSLVAANAYANLADLIIIDESESSEPAPGFEVDVKLDFRTRHQRSSFTPTEQPASFTLHESRATFALKQKLGSNKEVRAELRLSADLSDGVSNNNRVSDRVKSLYYQHGDQDDWWRWRVGRQPVSDDMGWMLDEDLDGIRITRRRFGKKIDAFVMREQWLEIGEQKTVDPAYFYYGELQMGIGESLEISPFLLHQYEIPHLSENNTEQTWLGFQSAGEFGRLTNFWLNSAARFGKSNDSDGVETFIGYAIDAGVSMALDVRLKPSVTFGYAHATGNKSNNKLRDTSFRQSGLHSNEHRFNGITRFQYLGEVVNPELTNIGILTVGSGIRFKDFWSADVVFHHYRQIELDDRLRGSDLDIDPSGLNSNIGQALDFVLGFNINESLELVAIAGTFKPGNAFEDERNSAQLLRIEMSYQF